uniref:Uncharacterized protein n=1 Tax=Arion vulgaris TaxID=1028688 RepID=A0A0B7ALP1_9EUPU
MQDYDQEKACNSLFLRTALNFSLLSTIKQHLFQLKGRYGGRASQLVYFFIVINTCVPRMRINVLL